MSQRITSSRAKALLLGLTTLLATSCGKSALPNYSPEGPFRTPRNLDEERELCRENRDPGESLVQRLREMADRAPPDAKLPAVLASLGAAIEQQQDLWRRHVEWSLARLPRETLPDISHWKKVVPQPISVSAFREQMTGDKDAQASAALFASPVALAWGVRSMQLSDPAVQSAGIDSFRRRSNSEQLAMPRFVWANDDAVHPVLAFVKRTDIFVVRAAYDAKLRTYLPSSIEWVIVPDDFVRPPTDSASAALLSYSDAIELQAKQPPKTERNYREERAAMWASAIEEAKRWIAPQADAVHRRTRCEFLRLPKLAKPAVPYWELLAAPKNSTSTAQLAALAPLAPWQPKWFAGLFFEQFHLDRQRQRERISTWAGVLDALVPWGLVRLNDDPDEAVIAVIDPFEAVVVSTHYDREQKRYQLGDTQWFVKPGSTSN